MDDIVDSVDRSCRLAELINDPTCNVILKPKELRHLLNRMNEMEQLLDMFVPNWEDIEVFSGEKEYVSHLLNEKADFDTEIMGELPEE